MTRRDGTDIPKRFLMVTRCLENLSSGENLAENVPTPSVDGDAAGERCARTGKLPGWADFVTPPLAVVFCFARWSVLREAGCNEERTLRE